MARQVTSPVRSIRLALIALIGVGMAWAPSLRAQGPSSVRVSATVISGAPAREAAQLVQRQAQHFATAPVPSQREVRQRLDTPGRLAVVTSERIAVVAAGRPSGSDEVRLTVEFAGN